MSFQVLTIKVGQRLLDLRLQPLWLRQPPHWNPASRHSSLCPITGCSFSYWPGRHNTGKTSNTPLISPSWRTNQATCCSHHLEICSDSVSLSNVKGAQNTQGTPFQARVPSLVNMLTLQWLLMTLSYVMPLNLSGPSLRLQKKQMWNSK